ncbi:MAG: flagellar motor protein MotB [Bacteroidota bacterium]
MVLFFQGIAPAQEILREPPVWWFGGVGAANLNFYSGTTQMLNVSFTTPAPFHKGFGAGIYLGALLEYRPDPMLGAMLQLAYDDRRAMFFDVPCPCGENSTLSAAPSYVSIEPSLRVSPFSDEFYIFGGPRIGYNFSFSSPDEKTFLYTQEPNLAVRSQFSGMEKLVFSGQIGVGYDFALTSPNDETQWELSPFISYQPYFGQDPRSDGHWGISTLRAGISIKFGSGDVIAQQHVKSAPVVAERVVQFSIRTPKTVPVKRRVRETFPLRNYVFFDEGSSEIPFRYERLTKNEATNFKEEQLQEYQPKSLEGRPLRQMTVYYNVLNIVGDRMKRSPGTTIMLSGASAKGEEHGKARAEAVKTYLVTIFGIDSSRISTEGREKPKNPSEMPGGKKELELLKEGDSRVDIESDSPEMMIQVGGPAHHSLKPIQIIAVVENPLDGHILFNAIGAKEAYSSWSIEITDSTGKIQRFGPYTRDRENVSGNAVLGNQAEGTYMITIQAQTKRGRMVRRDTMVHLVRREIPANDVVRYRILFDFDQSKTVENYETFITETIVPLIPDSGIVIIHGYTDIIGEEEYNENLSRERVQNARDIIERGISKSGKRGISFETFGFGENTEYAAFDNYFPEQRFYNRSVVIDIVPN